LELIKAKFKSALIYVKTFFKWAVIAGCTGLLSGIIGTLFHKSVELATDFRQKNDLIILCLPIGGIVILALYKFFKLTETTGTNEIISSVRTDEKVPPALAPSIFISTVITHLFGGSAGREGAALQLGGSIGSIIGRLFRLDEKDMHIVTLCGMSGVFSALFGTPMAAAFFALEVISVGVIYYAGLVPCILSALVAFRISLYFGVEPIGFSNVTVPDISFFVVLKIVVLAVICAVISILFCLSMKKTKAFMNKVLKNEYLRIFIGGLIVVALTFIIGSRDYNGAGMDIVTNAINGSAKPEAFLLKIIFTAITIGAGYKGGEIVPTFFIGATLGCIAGNLLGIGAGFGAAIGLIALFCSVVNCPVASIILSIEIFGAKGFMLFVIACAVSYMLSGYYGLYSKQKIVYSKLKAEYININTK
jgi:H+/Cl- antiporter ClcA